jgi:hypothetical protein
MLSISNIAAAARDLDDELQATFTKLKDSSWQIAAIGVENFPLESITSLSIRL